MLKTIIAGNLGGAAEVRTLDGGRTVISFSVAHTDTWTNKNGVKNSKTTWARCSLWRNEGQSIKISEYLTTGRPVIVEGSVEARAWSDKDGNAQASLELTVRNIELISGGGTSSARETSAPAQAAKPATTPQASPEEDDDLPF